MYFVHLRNANKGNVHETWKISVPQIKVNSRIHCDELSNKTHDDGVRFNVNEKMQVKKIVSSK